MYPLFALLLLATQDPAAYADSGAGLLVARARERRERAERLVTAYQATVTQRIGVGVRALRRDRMLFGQELAARISWRRDGPTRVEVIGARQRVPVAVAGDRVPDDLYASVEWLVIDPSADYLRIAGDDAEGFIHPLSEHSERHYRFASGDTTTVTLPDGRTIRVLELKVTPRRAEFRLMSGSLWFDHDSYALVRAVFAPARPFDIELDADSGEGDDVPGFLKPIRAEVRFVTLEYGLYQFRWWMPRFFALDAEAQASVMRVPLRFERVYSGYRVEGGGEPEPGARRPAGSVRRRERDSTAVAVRDSLRRELGECMRQARDSLRAERRRRGERGLAVQVGAGRFYRTCRDSIMPDDRWPVEVVLAGGDTAALLTNPELGEPILQMGDVITEGELRQLGREIGAIPQRPWQSRAILPSGLGSTLRYARYNRVEALSLGLGGELDFGRLQVQAQARLGVADLEPNGELAVVRPGRSMQVRLAGYRRLAVANPAERPLGAINSFTALLAGRDDGEYYRTLGVELTGEPAAPRWYGWRLFVERQRAAATETDASLPRLFDGDRRFRPTIVADAAGQAGAVLALRADAAPSGRLTFGADASLEGQFGTFEFGRGAFTGRMAATLSRRVAVAAEASAGTSVGTVPVQGRWYLGGPATLRGYLGGAARGEAYWRSRAELGYGIPVVRLAVFGDAGWAGSRARFGEGTTLTAAGIGGSFLDGLFRADLAKGLRASGGWRFDFYVDGVL